MKVNVKMLRRALEIACAAVPTSTIPYTISLEKDGDKLFVIGVGPEIKAMTPVRLENTEDDIDFIVKLYDNTALNMVRQIRTDYIDVQYVGDNEKGKLYFITESIKVQLAATMFQESNKIYFCGEPIQSISMGEGFKTKVNKTCHAVLINNCDARSESLFVETSSEKDCIRITGVDGHRIAIRDDGVGSIPLNQLMIPGRVLAKACDLLSSPPIIEVPQKSSSLRLRDKDGTVIVVPCLGGTYYNVEAFLEGFEEEIQVWVKKNELLNAISITRLMERCESKRAIDLTIISRTEISLSSTGMNGDADVRITCAVGAAENKKIEGFRIRFNSTYFKEAVESFDEQDIILSLMTPLRFGLFRNESRTIREYVLPLRPRTSTI